MAGFIFAPLAWFYGTRSRFSYSSKDLPTRRVIGTYSTRSYSSRPVRTRIVPQARRAPRSGVQYPQPLKLFKCVGHLERLCCAVAATTVPPFISHFPAAGQPIHQVVDV